jgi:hypothetical protein
MADRLARMHAHPLRDRVLFEYQADPMSPSEVARRLGRPVNLISYHTAVLVRHGCIELVRTEQRRGATTHFYRSTVAQTIDDEAWDGLPEALRRELVLGTLRVVAAEAHDAALAGRFDAPYAQLTRSQLALDVEGMREARDVLHAAFEALARIERESDARAGEAAVYEVAMIAFGSGAAPDVSRGGDGGESIASAGDQAQRRQTGSSATLRSG